MTVAVTALFLLVFPLLVYGQDSFGQKVFWEKRQSVQQAVKKAFKDRIAENDVDNSNGARGHYFQQRVDHFGNQPGIAGSEWFKQYFLVLDTYYEPDGPVLLFLGGESAITTKGLWGLPAQLAQEYGALLVNLEHRFYGAENNRRSVPTSDTSPESLKLLTSRQAIEDAAYFITSFPSLYPEYNLTSQSKWISIGGSYAGALSAWLREKHPELVYAAHASSAPVLANQDFWRYSYGIEAGIDHFSGSKTCMNGWTNAMKAMDQILKEYEGNDVQMFLFQQRFGLPYKVNAPDIGNMVSFILSSTVQYGPSYDYLIKPSFNQNGVTLMDGLCDGKHYPAFTNPNATSAELLESLQRLTKMYYFPYSSLFRKNKWRRNRRDDTEENLHSSYFWAYQECNELGYQPTSQSLDNTEQMIRNYTAYSQFVKPEHWIAACGRNKFPSSVSTAINTNDYYGGLAINISRILWVNGDVDPWHWLSKFDSPSSEQRSIIFPGSTHCNDMWGTSTARDDQLPKFYEIFGIYDEWLNITRREPVSFKWKLRMKAKLKN
ncbi:hypothetical protein HDU79_004917 [Rhizoclosmatium sp. JEL0117]|nr:hypothetical protein HDU79_004917 [Rhizoclosmatium sp. JEL0117]